MRQRGESVLGCASVCETQQDTSASNKTNHFVNEISRKLIIYPLPCHCFRQSSTAGVRKLSCHLLPVNNRKYPEQVLQGGAARLLLLLLEFLVQCWPWWIDSSAAFLSLPHDKIRWALSVDLWTLIRLSLAENTISRAAPMRFYWRIFLPFSKMLVKNCIITRCCLHWWLLSVSLCPSSLAATRGNTLSAPCHITALHHLRGDMCLLSVFAFFFFSHRPAALSISSCRFVLPVSQRLTIIVSRNTNKQQLAQNCCMMTVIHHLSASSRPSEANTPLKLCAAAWNVCVGQLWLPFI